MSSKAVAASTVLGLALAGLLGCRPSAHPADPATGRETLLGVLEAWQKGESPETHRAVSPAVTVVEHQWRQGVRLLRYELQGEETPNGFDVQFPVKLVLQDRAGKKFQENAVYNVSTSPALVVVRSEESQ